MFVGKTKNRVQNISFYSLLTNELNKLECCIGLTGKTYQGQTLELIWPIYKLQRNKAPRTVFTRLHFLRILNIAPVS